MFLKIFKFSIAYTIIFYLVYYIVLAALFAASLFVWFVILDENRPRLQGYETPLSLNPSLGFRPQPEYETTLIRFRHGKRATYKIYSDHLQAFIDQYELERQTGENMIECGTERTNLDSSKVCRFDLNQFMDTPCVKRLEYGFEDGTPCILLKLNRIYGWVPEPLDVPLAGSGSFNSTDRGAEIECHGVNQGDKENVGPIFYYPQNYFSTRFYPYLTQDSYRSPFIFVYFKQPQQQVIIMVECRVYAKNIVYNEQFKDASVRFELLID
jgi:sodium/potassium-transporting ATPase subunit beta